ncbi:YscQ/HrcQ family type III secretion apparatus protein [Phyllobacterium myrsinacearum]|uniref:YscQ/HrcQ family type III secretion apparatus protein n=2 Tax=Phyllobacterium myrsinacearum TaxID=28101 RepID=A0A2S9JPK0_9HYPH|nr:YscQ/HrcQ family type III secretion apparatus protein [Phyllobacterium myrsinacearum]
MNRPVRCEAFPPDNPMPDSTADLSWLPAIDSDHVDIMNLFHGNRAPFQVNVAGLSVELKLTQTASPLTDPVEIPVSIGAWHCKLVLSADTAGRLLQMLTASRTTLSLPSRKQSILFEYLLTEQLAILEQSIELPIRFGGQATHSTCDVSLPWIIRFDDVPRNAQLHLCQPAARILGGAINRSVPRTDAGFLTSVTFLVQLCIGTQELTVSELRDLRPGDVILRQQTTEADTFAVLSNYYAASTVPTDDGPMLSSDWQPLNQYSDHSMTSEPSLIADDKRGQFDDFDRLPIQLVFEIGRCELPLTDIRKLGEGSTVPIAPSITNPVNILANGRLIGTGELVKIGAGLGVRVVRLSNNG